VLGVAQVAGAVQCVQPSHGKAGGVADVVQPGGGFQEVGVSAEDWCQAARPRGDALDVGLAAREGFLEECLASCPAHEASVFMRPRLMLLSGRPVGVADGLRVQLRQGERGRHRLLAGDGRAELLADVRAEVLELRDVQEPDAGVRHRHDGGMR